MYRGPSFPPPAAGRQLCLQAVVGDAVLDAGAAASVVWLVLRGRLQVWAQEGDFLLAARDWIALGGDSSPRACPSRDALLLEVRIDAGVSTDAASPLLFPGRGRMDVGVRAMAMRLWQAHGVFAAGARSTHADPRHLIDFLSALQAELIDGIERCPGHSQRRKRQILSRMQRARLCLEGQAGSALRIADLAKRVNFSPWYFSKVFHAVYGIGPQQFAARMRLEHASRLLATTCLPVTEVSAACGFDSPCSFSRAFRARFGMTASEHRLRHAGAATWRGAR